ncbi:ethanolamine kinase 1-like [Planoprotostelium fungivorum]|uniref:ethanolamine kinase n=1 Tax=Planoprotostelium fungivorum TaxID=1890364 RepID=A0A2P6N112_9EUKA|nr:ethanolamine kinase 1-like [Planoprotostelium fungivorum]
MVANVCVSAFTAKNINRGRAFHRKRLRCVHRGATELCSTSNHAYECETHMVKEIDYKVELDGSSRIRDICHVVKTMVTAWADIPDEEFSVKEVQGGVTNKLYNCGPPDNHGVLIRIYGNQSEILIDRDGELKNLVHIYKNGFAPKFYGFFKNGFVYGFFPGRDLTPQGWYPLAHVTCDLMVADLQEGKFTEEIARQMALWHQQEVPSAPRDEPSLFVKLNSWLSLVPTHYETPEKQKKFEIILNQWDIQEEAKFLREALEAVDSPIVFAHNDLIGKNIIYDEATDEIHFIDYEYGAYNFRAFDLANHFCEFAGFELDYSKYPPKEMQYKYFRTYFSTFYNREATEEDLHNMYVEISRFALASHFMWATWGLVQGEISDIDFDFMQYAVDRFSQYYLIRDSVLAL